MDSAAFKSQMDRLGDLFGYKYYNEDRLILIWREVKELSDNWFRHIVDGFIGNCRQPPLMPEFREEISKERERLWKIEKQRHKEEPSHGIGQYICLECSNTGIVFAEHNGESNYAFKCTCENGSRQPGNFPRLQNLYVVRKNKEGSSS